MQSALTDSTYILNLYFLLYENKKNKETSLLDVTTQKRVIENFRHLQTTPVKHNTYKIDTYIPQNHHHHHHHHNKNKNNNNNSSSSSNKEFQLLDCNSYCRGSCTGITPFRHFE